MNNNDKIKILEQRMRTPHQSQKQISILKYMENNYDDRIKLEDEDNSQNSDKKIEPDINNQKITDYFQLNKKPCNKRKPNLFQKMIKQKVILSDNELQQKVDELQQQILEKDNIINNLQFQLKNYENNFNNKFNAYKKNIQEIICKTILENENSQRREFKTNMMLQRIRIGENQIIREGPKFQEIWVDGSELTAKKQKLKDLEEFKQQLQNQKLNLINKKKDSKSNMTDFIFTVENSQSESEEPMDVIQQKNKINFQLQMLQKEEQFLKQELDKLLQEKQILIKQNALMQEEEYCRFSKQQIQVNNIFSAWPLLNQKYQLVSLLGKGGYSEVYKAYDVENLRFVACKVHQLVSHWSTMVKTNYIKHAIRENEIHQNLNHCNIVKDYDTLEIDDNSFVTVLEYCKGPDLSFFLKQNQFLSEKESKKILKQILNGIKYLHDYKTKIIHYDLKPQNILFHQGEIKITDFGLCKLMEQGQTKIELTSQGVGTYWYLPPECFEQGTPHISPKVDIWSIGVIFFEMLYGQKPFGHNMSQQQIIADGVILRANQVHFPSNKVVSTDAKEFIRNCLKYNQEERWDVDQAINSTYIKKY